MWSFFRYDTYSLGVPFLYQNVNAAVVRPLLALWNENGGRGSGKKRSESQSGNGKKRKKSGEKRKSGTRREAEDAVIGKRKWVNLPTRSLTSSTQDPEAEDVEGGVKLRRGGLALIVDRENHLFLDMHAARRVKNNFFIE